MPTFMTIGLQMAEISANKQTNKQTNTQTDNVLYIQGDLCNSDECFFGIISEVMKPELIGWAQKKPTFIGFMNIFTILKSVYWSPHSALFSKSGQNREKCKLRYCVQKLSG